jgi:hypothetical protein
MFLSTFFIVHINHIKWFHCYISICGYSIVWPNSTPLLLCHSSSAQHLLQFSVGVNMLFSYMHTINFNHFTFWVVKYLKLECNDVSVNMVKTTLKLNFIVFANPVKNILWYFYKMFILVSYVICENFTLI